MRGAMAVLGLPVLNKAGPRSRTLLMEKDAYMQLRGRTSLETWGSWHPISETKIHVLGHRSHNYYLLLASYYYNNKITKQAPWGGKYM